MPVSIIPEASPAANLPFHWRTASTHSKTSIFILNSNTVVFIPTTQDVFLFRQPLTWEQWSPIQLLQNGSTPSNYFLG